MFADFWCVSPLIWIVPSIGRCAICGSTARTFGVAVRDTLEVRYALKLTGFRAGMGKTKGWFLRHWARLVPQHSRGGAIAKFERTIQRDRNWYAETVIMRDTGEVVHHCSEPLSQHTGHGSDKPKTL
jgi:hypothetical protein